MTESTDLLVLANVESAYGPIRAVRGVSLTVRRGEIVTVLGSNGAGKSTILKTISGVLAPTRGTVSFKGDDITALDPAQIVRSGLVHVPEGREVFPLLSVHDNLMMGGYTRNDRDTLQSDLSVVYGYFPILKDKRNQLSGTLSGGQLQMVCVGRGLMSSPKMIMLDEPSAALAPQVVMDIFRTIHRITRDGMTVLMVEQNVRMALLLAQYGYVIKDGVIHIEGPAENLIHDDNVRLSYLGGTVANREAQL